MQDYNTGRSKGYGFVSFRTEEAAERAIEAMNGEVIGTRKVRCGWAQHKAPGGSASEVDEGTVDQADPTNTNVYVGNVSPQLSDDELRAAFGAVGEIAEVKLYRKGGYGFVRYKRHADAVRAIVEMNGQELGGRTLKCSWGRFQNGQKGSKQPSAAQQQQLLLAAAGMSAVPLVAQSVTPVLLAPQMGQGMLMQGMRGGMPAAMVTSQGLQMAAQQGLAMDLNSGALYYSPHLYYQQH